MEVEVAEFLNTNVEQDWGGGEWLNKTGKESGVIETGEIVGKI